MNINGIKADKSSLVFKIIIGLIIELSVAAVFLAVFAFIMYCYAESFKYASVFGTLSLASGCFASSFFVAKKEGSKGWLIGLIIGILSFVVITLVALAVNNSSVTFNTLFRLLILSLSSVIGGVLGVNKGNNHKYI